MDVKIQTTLKGEAAERFVAAMERNHRTMAGEAAFRLEQSLAREAEQERRAVECA